MTGEQKKNDDNEDGEGEGEGEENDMMMDGDFENKENKLAAQIQQQISEDLQKDERLRHFVCDMTEDEKDKLTCDEVLTLYLRHVSK